MSAHPSLSDWPDERRFSELVATHRSGFAAGTDVAPLDVSRFPPSASFDDSCAAEGAAPVVGYEEGIRRQERCPWLVVAIVVGFVGAIVLSALNPPGFAPW
jgi:hypothetical protein